MEDWAGDGAFVERFPNIFNLDRKKSCFISDRIRSNRIFSWNWKQIPSNQLEITKLNALSSALSHVKLVHGRDKWSCKLSSDSNFYVNHLRNLIDSRFTAQVANLTIWVHLAPIKVSGFIWRACLDWIPSAATLSRRGVSISFSNCQFGLTGLDDTYHIFVGCPFAKDV